jgi:hypothetical protein
MLGDVARTGINCYLDACECIGFVGVYDHRADYASSIHIFVWPTTIHSIDMQVVHIINDHMILQLTNHHYINYIVFHNKMTLKMINITHMTSILNSVFTIVFYTMRWIKSNLTCICFKEFLNQLNLFYIYICLYLQPDKSYEPRELMGRIMGYDHSLCRNDIVKFIYFSMIIFLIYLWTFFYC